ncbi:MAG: hypothetical protein HOG99_13670 [Gemmatimonadetes bacterium]|nr:hypothetical protein [Gemmatimonadota bacterium]MBT5962589.1 hypothetical protein [Gemmatimonadota bacterium]MBT6627523.1 hypothetical protein [Gemmatimonadota bacterium]MBT7453264.1 hypothetical protein [Gemmatimonadota bacterium]
MSASQERYNSVASNLIEGHDQLTACRLAGFSDSSRGSASRICNHERVRERVSELQAEIAQRVVTKAAWDRTAILKALQANAIDTRARGDFAASNRAIELLGRDQGMFGGKGDVQIVEQPVSPEDEAEEAISWLEEMREKFGLESIQELIDLLDGPE